jgi:type I restriction enzyme M protein
MAIKKSELYSTLWKSCDELRGGMDSSQYKDYVLVMLFIKYVSDKYAGVSYAPIEIPKGSSFKDMISLKGDTEIGDKINSKIIAPLATANNFSTKDFPDFNDPTKLGSGKEMVDRLTNLIAIFENPALDFSKNKAEGDDILGDAYEYLMRHFATESGKSKGQFYTPAEVSRIMAKILGIKGNATPATTIYDPTCGSGSLLLKVADEAEVQVSIFGQENESPTVVLARMNMILHDSPSAVIMQGNTIANPKFINEKGGLQTFSYVVANPPFSYKSWSNGIEQPLKEPFGRFKDYGVPPDKNGDYAFLLHILKSLKSNGKGAVILPHGVLFRGNAEAEIRKALITQGFIKAIIGLPANLFYGTGIPACIILLDKENAAQRKGIFMIDAGKGFMKDGNKNRLREMDIHKIVDVFTKQLEVPKYSRMVPLSEIADAKNDYNLNIPRYIDSQEEEDLQDIEAHLLGGIPKADVDALENYWKVYPALKEELFKNNSRSNYLELKAEKEKIKETIFNHPQFISNGKIMLEVFNLWRGRSIKYLKALDAGCKPKEVIHTISEDLLEAYTGKDLIDKYDVYQHLMDYWAEVMQDDLYVIASDGWKAGNEVIRIIKESKNKKGTAEKEVEGIEGLEGKLIPPALMIEVFFKKEQQEIEELTAQKEASEAQRQELQEEHGTEDGLLAEVVDDKGKISKKTLQGRIKELGKPNAENKEELEMLKQYLELLDKEAGLADKIKKANKELEKKLIAHYPALTELEIKTVVVEQKWMAFIEKELTTEMSRISQRLTQRVKELAERYESPLPQIDLEVKLLEEKVNAHLQKMGLVW